MQLSTFDARKVSLLFAVSGTNKTWVETGVGVG